MGGAQPRDGGGSGWPSEYSHYSFPVEDETPQVSLKPATPAEPIRYYDHVAVLLLRWADEVDELKTGPEVSRTGTARKLHFDTYL